MRTEYAVQLFDPKTGEWGDPWEDDSGMIFVFDSVEGAQDWVDDFGSTTRVVQRSVSPWTPLA